MRRQQRARPPQVDRHIPTMTVRETFEFAFDSMNGGTHDMSGDLSMLSDQQKELVGWMDKKGMKVIFFSFILCFCLAL